MLGRNGPRQRMDISIGNLLFVCQLCLIIVSFTSSAERVHHSRFFRDLRHTDDGDPEQKVVISESRAKKFLQEFGYMQKFDRNSRKWQFTDWKYDGPYPSKKESLESSDDESFVIIEDWGSEVERLTAIDPESSDNPEEQKLFHDAVKQFQKQNNLPVSGQVDEQTMKMFVRPRCGVPDNLGRFLIKNTSKELQGISSQNTPTEKQRFPNLHTLLRSTAPNVKQSQMSKLIDLTTPSSADMLTTVLTSYDDAQVPSTTPEPVRHRRALSFQDFVQRKKRSQYIGSPDTKFAKTVLTWRIYSDYHSENLLSDVVRDTIELAFRMWAEVSPLVFVEDLNGDILNVDVKIAFATGGHVNCNYPFDPSEMEPSQYSHAFFFSEIHFNDNVHFTVDSDQGISLLRTAVHEIGHVLGLQHQLTQQESVMYPTYIHYDDYDEDTFALPTLDRHAIQDIYGKCSGSFDSVFDWIRPRPDGTRVYNSYFFNNSLHWMYENRLNRTRPGYPSEISDGWTGIPNNIDAIIHVWHNPIDKLYFFVGTHVIEYDSSEDRAIGIDPATGLAEGDPISVKFPGIPDNLDTGYFDKKDKNIYFFKNSSVYVFDPNTNSVVSGYPRPINQVFTNRFSTNQPLENNIDAAYYSYKHRALFFFKDNRYWRNYYSKNSSGQYIRRVGFPQNWNEFWNDICVVE